MPTPVDDGDLTQILGWDSLPAEVRATLADAHLPASFLVRESSANFILGPDVTEVDVPSLGRLVRFGYATNRFNGAFCLDPATGAVHMVMPEIPPIFVNSSVDQLAETMRLVGRFERDITTGDAEDCLIAVHHIREGLEKIDEPAAHPDHYWGSLTYDFEAGDYSDNPDF